MNKENKQTKQIKYILSHVFLKHTKMFVYQAFKVDDLDYKLPKQT